MEELRDFDAHCRDCQYQFQQKIRHGVNCAKALHVAGDGYMHGEFDDRPYLVDGLRYCGRCHMWLGGDRG